jgi:hypothetical protein
MVKPLSPGAHTIHFTGAVSAFGFGMHINYNLAVGGQMVTAGSLQGAAQAVGSGTDGPLPRKGLTWGRLKSIYR